MTILALDILREAKNGGGERLAPVATQDACKRHPKRPRSPRSRAYCEECMEYFRNRYYTHRKKESQ